MRTKDQATTNQRLRAGDFATLFSEGAEERIEPPAPARRAHPYRGRREPHRRAPARLAGARRPAPDARNMNGI